MHDNTRRLLRHALLLATLVAAGPAAAQETGDTGDTGDTGTVTDTSDTGDTTPGDTGTSGFTIPTEPEVEFCTNCSSAADLAAEEGGTPCGEGCATTAGGVGTWLWAPMLVALVGRRRRVTSSD